MKQTCSDCKTIIEIDENEYPEGSRLEKECPVCGATVVFQIPKREPKVIIKEVPQEFNLAKVEAQNARIAELEAEMRRMREQQMQSDFRPPSVPDVSKSSISNDTLVVSHAAEKAYPVETSSKSSQSTVSYSSSQHVFSNEAPKLDWNWGAFLLSGLWGLFNGSAWAFFVLLLLSWIPVAGGIIDLIVCIVLGVKGSKWAWANKTWKSAEHFNRVQHKWAVAGAIVFVLSLVIGIIAALASIGI